jgi:hypothetical protein
METFKATCDNHIPVKPPPKKNKIKEKEKRRATSHFKAPLSNVIVQLTTLTVAGKEIITVIVL